MDLAALTSKPTQILYFTVNANDDISRTPSTAGKAWNNALSIIERSKGFEGLHWGRSVEQPDKLQLHIVRSSLADHCTWLQSPEYEDFLSAMAELLDGSKPKPYVRHIMPMTIYTSSPTDPFHAPFTGTAIYLRTTQAWHEGSWPCWTHVVRHVKGCTGIAGGRMVEPYEPEPSRSLAGKSAPSGIGIDPDSIDHIENCYMVYVGWQTIEDHNNYHHTQHFRDHRVILSIGNEGWREYGHVKFEGWRHAAGKQRSQL